MTQRFSCVFFLFLLIYFQEKLILAASRDRASRVWTLADQRLRVSQQFGLLPVPFVRVYDYSQTSIIQTHWDSCKSRV